MHAKFAGLESLLFEDLCKVATSKASNEVVSTKAVIDQPTSSFRGVSYSEETKATVDVKIRTLNNISDENDFIKNNVNKKFDEFSINDNNNNEETKFDQNKNVDNNTIDSKSTTLLNTIRNYL
jgi:hypothetical protein